MVENANSQSNEGTKLPSNENKDSKANEKIENSVPDEVHSMQPSETSQKEETREEQKIDLNNHSMLYDPEFPFDDQAINNQDTTENSQQTENSKQSKFNPETQKYYLNFNGEYQHVPMISSRNIVLENKEGLPNFIVRKMDLNLYEIECSQILDPLSVFTRAFQQSL